jgi:thiopurine S-methyltransferase
MKKLDKAYWDERYRSQQIAWNIGYPSTPIVDYIDQLEDKASKILVPGAGNAYEVEYLHESGFKNTYMLDISPLAIESFRKRLPAFPEDHMFNENFFDHKLKYDIIIEQTFFCALDPGLRVDYVQKMYELLKPGGKLAGLLFNFPLTEEGPPFGGSLKEYQNLFQQKFNIKIMEPCYNSIVPRAGKELFILLIAK